MNSTLQHILCVDDEADILEVAQLSLETVGGFKVTCLSSGVDAIAQAENIQPDLIMLDVMMPKMDGPATLAELRKCEALKDVPIIFMTARVQPLEVRRYLELGANHVTAKPFDAMALSDEVRHIWEQHHGH